MHRYVSGNFSVLLTESSEGGAKRSIGEVLFPEYASIRHLARWVHRKVKPFPLRSPTDGVKPPEEPEPEWKGVSRAEELRVWNTAQSLRGRPGRGTNQRIRDHAALTVLLGSVLRASKVLNLTHAQDTRRGVTNVLMKGGWIRDFVSVQAQARQVRDAWLTLRGDGQGALFTTRSGQRLSRVQLCLILQRVAAQAHAHLTSAEKVKVSPHVFRPTFLRKRAEEKGVPYAQEACGHKSARYIWRSVKPSQQSLAVTIDELDA